MIYKRLFSKTTFIFLGIMFLFFLIKIASFDFFSQLNTIFTDQLQGFLTPRKEIMIVEIDEKSLQQIGPWPWSRQVFAQVLANLNPEKPRIVGIDVLFLDKREEDEEVMYQLSKNNYPLTLAGKIDNETFLQPVYTSNLITSGFINLNSQSDGKIRQFQNKLNISNTCVTSFASSVFEQYLGKKLAGCINESTPLYYNYTRQAFSHISFIDVYNRQFPKDSFRNKIVLVGFTTKDLKSQIDDNFTDIFGAQTPGIKIHAQIINSLLHNRFQRDIPQIYFYIICLFISVITLAFFILSQKKLSFRFLTVGLIWLFTQIVGVMLFEFGINWFFVQFSFIWLGIIFYILVFDNLKQSKERQFLKQAFQQYISPKLLPTLLKHPEKLALGGEKRQMTVLFCDIRSFTSYSEKVPPEKLVESLNQYLELMSSLILDEQGTIDNFIGDAIMAFWNAPLFEKQHELKAVKTALKMLEALHKLHTDWQIGIGINSGEMIVGNIGGSKRFDYTVLGDNVNLASRVEGLTKKYGVNILITEAVKNKVKDPTIMYRLIDEVVVKGKNQAVKLYQPLLCTRENQILKNEYEKGFTLYQQGKFTKALQTWDRLINDPVVYIMQKRIVELQKDQNRLWDGIWRWEHK